MHAMHGNTNKFDEIVAGMAWDGMGHLVDALERRFIKKTLFIGQKAPRESTGLAFTRTKRSRSLSLKTSST